MGSITFLEIRWLACGTGRIARAMAKFGLQAYYAELFSLTASAAHSAKSFSRANRLPQASQANKW